MLSARLDLPPGGSPSAYALFAHCFTCSKNIRAAVNISRALSREGFGVVRFDFTGLGESEGEFEDTNFSSNVADLLAAAGYMERSLGTPQLLVGHSLGGAAVLQAVSELPGVRAVATVGVPADPAHVLVHMESSLEEIEETGAAQVSIGGRPFRVRKQFLDDLRAQRMEHTVANLSRPLLLFHSPIDTVVGIENASRLYAMARHPKSFVSLDRADHLLTDPRDSSYVGTVLAAWATRYVDLAGEEATVDALRTMDRVVTCTPRGAFRTEVRIRAHGLVADEPRAMGGEDAGPSPYELLAAGLGACTSMTLEMYARRKGWPLEEARVRLRHDRIHRIDEEACADGDDARLDVIEREIELVGALDAGQRARLLEIARRCPVHRTLEAGADVVTRERA